jgi:hypothetical protein
MATDVDMLCKITETRKNITVLICYVLSYIWFLDVYNYVHRSI